MKTTKVILVTALMAFASIGFAQSEVQPMTKKHITHNKILIAFQDAIQIHGLFTEMHRQVSPDILIPDQYAYYAHVNYRGNLYVIKGSYDSWAHFFESKLTVKKKK
ncbi:MAG: hypothetical protein R2764_03250 [Bacteroidales bacterium]